MLKAAVAFRRQPTLRMTALVWVATSMPALAQSQPAAAGHPFQGDWSLEFRVATRPGGETRVASRGLVREDVQTVNLLAQMSRPSFTVAADGILHWEQREGGLVHWDDFSRLMGRTSVYKGQPILRVQGKTTATPAPPGSGRSYDRRLTLDLAWAGGEGSLLDHRGVPFRVPAAAAYERSKWELEPASVQREELAPDVIRETTIFRASRQRATDTYKFGVPQAPFPVTERIEIKHVHHLRLVPRDAL